VIPHAVQRLDIDLGLRLDFDEAHRQSGAASAIASASMMSLLFDFTYGFTNSAGMILTMCRAARACVLAIGSQDTSIATPALGGLEEPKESIPPELCFLDDGACRICSDDVENVLADVDAENRGGLRLISKHFCSFLATAGAHCARGRRGRPPH
jgi:hypothetical protein